MENLIKQLQIEAGLTEDQAVKSIQVIKRYMDEENISIDWNKFFKGKYEEYKKKYKTQVNDLTDKVIDKVEDVTIQTKRAARDLTKKIHDKLDD